MWASGFFPRLFPPPTPLLAFFRETRAQQPAAEADRRPLKRRIVSRSTHHPTTTATEDAREVPLRTPTTYQARPTLGKLPYSRARKTKAEPKSKVQRNAALSHTLNRATRLLPRSMLLGTGSLEISAYGTAASSTSRDTRLHSWSAGSRERASISRSTVPAWAHRASSSERAYLGGARRPRR